METSYVDEDSRHPTHYFKKSIGCSIRQLQFTFEIPRSVKCMTAVFDAVLVNRKIMIAPRVVARSMPLFLVNSIWM